MRAAASSIASGSPSRRAQICSIRSSSPVRQLQPRVERAGAADEQLRRRLGGQRRHAELVLALDAQRGAARDHELALRRGGQQAAELGRGVEHLLEVVDHEQDRVPRQHRGRLALARAERLGDLGRDQRRVLEARQRDEPGAVGELRREPVRELEREVRLADPARAGQREQPDVRVAQQLGRGRQVVLAAEQRRRRERQRRRLERRGRGRRRRCGRVELERRVLGQDRGLQALELRARVEAEVLHQRVPRAPVGLERVGLAPGAVQREHQLRVQALAVGVLGREALELADDLGVAAEREVVRDPLLERLQAGAGDPVGLDDRGPDQRRVGQRRAAEQRQRLAQQLGGLGGLGVAGAARPAPRSAAGPARRRRAAIAYPPERVTIVSAPSARRSCEISTCSALVAVAGGCSPHSTSISRSAETTSCRCSSSSIASSERCLGALMSIGPSGPTTRNGPRIANSITPSQRVRPLKFRSSASATASAWDSAAPSATALVKAAGPTALAQTSLDARGERRFVGLAGRAGARRAARPPRPTDVAPATGSAASAAAVSRQSTIALRVGRAPCESPSVSAQERPRARPGSSSTSTRASPRWIEATSAGSPVAPGDRDALLEQRERARGIADAGVREPEVLQQQAERALVADLARDRGRVLVAADRVREVARVHREHAEVAATRATRSGARPIARASSRLSSKYARAAPKSPCSPASTPAPLARAHAHLRRPAVERERRVERAPRPSATLPRITQ